MDDINKLFQTCGKTSTNLKGLPIIIRDSDHSAFAVRSHLLWINDQLKTVIKEEILGSPDCGKTQRNNAWRLVRNLI